MSDKNPSYETAITELEKIVAQMEASSLPLAQSLKAYKRGAKLLKICQQSLAEAEQQIRILSDQNALIAYTLDDKQPRHE